MRDGEVIDDRYVLVDVLGRGAMGVVYRARHVRVGCEVALKVIHEHLMADPDMVRRFDREVALAGRLAHDNVVAVLDTGDTADGRRYMVMELAHGVPLGRRLAAGPLPPAVALDLIAQLLRGLQHAHARGLVHRDLKPDNILVDDAGHVRIVDFGIAVSDRDDDRRLTDAGVVMGTPHYMAPEQAQGLAPDPRTDLFALGVIAYEMLAGVRPFTGTGVDVVLATVSRDVPPMSRRAPDIVVDRELEVFVYRLLERRPEDRFASATDALDAVQRIGDLDGWDEVTAVYVRAA